MEPSPDSNVQRRMSLVDNDHERLSGETKTGMSLVFDNDLPPQSSSKTHDITDDLEINATFSSESFTSIFGPVVLTMTLAAIAVVNINSPTTQSLGEQLDGPNRITPNFRKTKAAATFTKLPLVLANGASHQSCRWCLGETRFSRIRTQAKHAHDSLKLDLCFD